MLEYPPNVLWRWKQCKHIWVCRVLPHLTDCVIWALCPIHYSDSITHHLSGGLSDASPLAKMRDLPSVVSNKSCGMLLEIANLNQCNKTKKHTVCSEVSGINIYHVMATNKVNNESWEKLFNTVTFPLNVR